MIDNEENIFFFFFYIHINITTTQCNRQQYKVKLPVSLAKRINKQREQIDKFKMEIAKGYSKEEDLKTQVSKLQQEKEHLNNVLNDKTYDFEMKIATLQSEKASLVDQQTQNQKLSNNADHSLNPLTSQQ